MKYDEYRSVDEKWVQSIPAHWKMMRLKESSKIGKNVTILL